MISVSYEVQAYATDTKKYLFEGILTYSDTIEFDESNFEFSSVDDLIEYLTEYLAEKTRYEYLIQVAITNIDLGDFEERAEDIRSEIDELSEELEEIESFIEFKESLEVD